MKIAVVTGTSTGIGLTTSLHLARNGYQVFAGMRNLAKADALQTAAAAENLPVTVVQLDVCDTDSVKQAFAEIEKTGPVDVLINNAGIGGAAPLELVPEAEHKQMFETNYFGVVRCIQAVLPSMRERQTGSIVNITSAVGLQATPNQIAYSASKWALECLGEALAHEVYRFGVRVVNVEPGVIMTSIFENSAEQTRYDKTSPYQPIMRRNGKVFSAGFKRAVSPDLVAETILESITTDDYKLRWPVGPDAEGFMAARTTVPSEDWIAMGADLTDDEYNEKFKSMFGIDI
ncbi:MAG: SDR family oxidoreductase [Pseudomonadales bacterium]|jgi:NAD(P)-dependent dehydrogenase (short-subunit alcohol dehydrogenase family)|tara:strand:- start:2124 stop:2990 length:867 start_codon:yes stop_codon:yes gene_type:complete